MRTLFFDMDGVLCDFVGGALKVHGKHIPREQVKWEFYEQIGLTASQLYKPLENAEFWANLEPIEAGLELFHKLKPMFKHVEILTSCGVRHSYDGKRDWLRKHLPGMEYAIAGCTNKFALACKSKYLIDDHTETVNKFVNSGGRAYLFSQPWNQSTNSIDDIVDAVRGDIAMGMNCG